MKDVQIKLRMAEFALSMGQSTNDAAVMDARTDQSREECVLSMGQSSNDVAVKGAPIKLSEEEYVGDTEHTATPTMNRQLLHHNLGQNLTKLL